MKSRSRLHVTCTLERRRIKSILFDSVRGNGSIGEGAVEEKKLKRLTQAWHGHRIFQPLLCSLISFTCKIVFCCSHILWFWYYSYCEQSESSGYYLSSPPASQFVINKSLSLLTLSHLLLLLLLLEHCCLLFCFVRSLCLSLEDIALSLLLCESLEATFFRHVCGFSLLLLRAFPITEKDRPSLPSYPLINWE